MGHFGNIGNHWLPSDIFTHGKGQIGRKLLKRVRLQQIPQQHRAVCFIGHLDAYGRLSWYGRLDTDIGRRQIQLDIVCQIDNPAHLHALFRLQFISGYRRSAAGIGYRDVDAEVFQRLLQLHGSLLDLGSRVCRSLSPGSLQQRHRRKTIFLLCLVHRFLFLDIRLHFLNSFMNLLPRGTGIFFALLSDNRLFRRFISCRRFLRNGRILRLPGRRIIFQEMRHLYFPVRILHALLLGLLILPF